jgi:hypothetical protein
MGDLDFHPRHPRARRRRRDDGVFIKALAGRPTSVPEGWEELAPNARRLKTRRGSVLEGIINNKIADATFGDLHAAKWLFDRYDEARERTAPRPVDLEEDD